MKRMVLMGFVTKGYGGMTTFLIGQKQHMAITGLQHTHPALVRFRANVGITVHEMG